MENDCAHHRAQGGVGSFRYLGWFAYLTTACALLVIALGGLVTSKGAGLAVPDWPTTYGYNMFLFPLSKWVGGIFYEHTHRLAASGLGLFTLILAAWIWFKHPSRSLRMMAVTAALLVVVQGILGGLRVVLLKDEIGIIHAAIAQLFLGLLLLIALRIAPGWQSASAAWRQVSAGTARLIMGVTAAIFLQLLIGAGMRHQHAGLAVPDFPLAYGQVWPDTSPDSLQKINRQRMEVTASRPITAGQIHLHMLHRLMALVIFGGILIVTWKLVREEGLTSPPGRLALTWFLTACIQVVLGASTVWSNKAADIATLHVVVGALVFLMGLVLSVRWIGSHALPYTAATVPPLSPTNHDIPGLSTRPLACSQSR